MENRDMEIVQTMAKEISRGDIWGGGGTQLDSL